MNEIEKKIVTAIIEDAIAIGCFVRVYDGEQYVTKRTKCIPCILDAMASTDSDVLSFYNYGDRKGTLDRVGWVALIYGNDHDIISDCSDNQRTNAILERATRISNEICSS